MGASGCRESRGAGRAWLAVVPRGAVPVAGTLQHCWLLAGGPFSCRGNGSAAPHLLTAEGFAKR
jgi:hypothetical protein